MIEDIDKTKEQLIHELELLRQRNAKFEELARHDTAEHELAELALQESEARHRTYVEAAPDGIFVVNSVGCYVDVNAAACRMTGYTMEELLALSIPDLMAPDSPPESIAFFETLKKRGRLHGEVLLERKDGSTLPVSIDAVRLPDDRFMAFCADITERKESEKQLHRQAAVVASSTDMVALLDRDFNYLFANEAYLTRFRKTIDEVVGQKMSDIDGEQHFETFVRPNAERCFAGKTVFSREWRNFPGTGRTHMDVTYDPYVGPDNKVFGFVLRGRDTTAQKVAEDQLEENKEFLTSFKSNIPGVVVIKDVQGRIIEANSAFVDAIGLQMDDVVGKTAYEIFPQDEADRMLTHHQQVLCDIAPSTIEERVLHSDGVMHDYLTTRFPVRSAEAETVAVASIAVDITERKRAEQQRLDMEAKFQQTQKLESLGVLAGGVAHDFNNLLMGVLGHAELALTTLSSEAPARDSIEKIQQAGTRAANLAHQMLAYSGKGHFIIRAVSLSEVVQEMGDLLSASVSKTTSLSYDLDGTIFPIEADVSQIHQVVMNLVTNASESLHEDCGNVKITTGVMECDKTLQNEHYVADERPDGTYAFLEVSDTGVGMDEETTHRIFDPFFTTKFVGRGLGLAAVFGIVRGHKGAIRVESGLGLGTTVRVLLPVAEKPAESSRDSGDAEARPGIGGTILLVDDEPTVLEVGAQMLTEVGYEVVTARDGIEAVEVFQNRAQDVACVVLDLTMPKMNGEETLVELKQIRSSVPVLLSSGYNAAEIEAQITAEGFAGFIEKPYRLKELRNSIWEVLSA